MIRKSTMWIMDGVALITIALAAVVIYLATPYPKAPEPRPMPPCAAEDGGPYPCLWDGPNRGNRHGDRVIVTGAP